MAMLPPGAGFLPTDEILVGYYLRNKNSEQVQNFHGSDLIRELNLYEYDPIELSYTSFYYTIDNRRQFYCFTAKVGSERRHCRTGFWMKKGITRDINGGDDNVVLGQKSLFMFYLGNSVKDAVRTNWIMYEYALADKPQAPFVVCRVFDCPPAMDLGAEFGALSDVEEGDAAGDDSDVTRKLKGAGAGAGSSDGGGAAEQGDASHFTDFQGSLQASYAAFLDNVVFHVEAITPEQFKLAIMEEDLI